MAAIEDQREERKEQERERERARGQWKCNEHGTIYAILSDFGDRMTTQSMGLMVLF